MINIKNIRLKKPEMKNIRLLIQKLQEKLQTWFYREEEATQKEAQSDEMMDLSSKLRMQKRRIRIRTVAITAAVVTMVAGTAIYRYVRVFREYSIVESVERSDDAVTKYARVKNRILKCNPNGVTCVNKANEVQWNTTFTMQSPMVDECEDMVVVGDQRGSEIYVFNEKGLVGNFDVEYTLVKVRVAAQGVVAAIMEDGDTTWVNVYDANGDILVKNKTSMAESGYPVDMDISSDGQKMVVSYLGIDNSNVKSRIAFYNFSSVGQGQANNLVSSAEYSGHVVPQTIFLDSNYAVAYRDDGLTFFSGRQVPEETKAVQVDQEMISVFSSEDYVGYVTLNSNEDRKEKYYAQIFRKNGSRSAELFFDTEYRDIKMEGEDLILYNSNEIEIYTANGSHKFSGQYEKQIVEVSKLNGSRRYSVQTLDSTDEIHIK
ncbi:MAG: DUF5711 family protein [Eubacteriales bacterium]|nr:DUF5711 family protein [Eubacteriales bacterium]